ncbi:MAG TPA: sugar ABC transporter ATP-binding protein [Trebonia sp.]|jgi:ribose transport system ATP-binding protein|nr:sugar ABC transporter ATP-binding protein [Trebonia sp.]
MAVELMTPSQQSPPVLRLAGTAKTYPNGTRALRGVDLAVRSGSVHGLVGANGAGKSTLIKILSGATPPTAGSVFWRGQEVTWRSPAAAQRAGVATVYQDTPLVPTMTVLENVYVGHHGRAWRPAAKLPDFGRIALRVGYEIDPMRDVGELSIGERQMVAILQAVSREPALLIMDEPTASLSQEERDIVFRAVRRLSGDGCSVIFVSHLLDEVLSLTEAVTVLRDGRTTLNRATAELDEDTLVRSIVGDLPVRAAADRTRPSGDREREPVLKAAGLSSPGKVARVDLTVHAGEVVGIAGLLGSGRSEILHAIFGADKKATGEVWVAGRKVRRSPVASVKAGLALVPEDRGQQGLVADWEIWRNISLPYLSRLSWWSVVPSAAREHARAQAAVRGLSIRASSVGAPVRELSGGNAQKVLLAKWMDDTVKVLLLDEPTVGIDIGAKREVQEFIRRQAAAGLGVVLVDSEFDQLVAVCDRILIVSRGRVIAERQAAQTSEHDLMSLAAGLSA